MIYKEYEKKFKSIPCRNSQQYYEQSHEVHMEFRDALAKEYLPNVPEKVSSMVWDRAWDKRRFDGYERLESYYSILAIAANKTWEIIERLTPEPTNKNLITD